MPAKHLQAPVAVGGLGGSGTRVIAQVLKELGYYIGPTNESLDNFWFATLIKRPKWYRHADPQAVEHGLQVFEKMSFRHEKLTLRDYRYLMQAGWERLWSRYNYQYSFSQQIRKLPGIFQQSGRKPVIHPELQWGWKEPNTHIFLEHLTHRYKKLRYIHLVRNGLDMAFSSNQNQLHIWGDRFDITPPKSQDKVPEAALTFWVRANKRAIKNGKALLGPRFLELHFETLCSQPKETITSLLTFLDMEVPDEVVDKLATIPQMPPTAGRFRKHDLGIFHRSLIEEVADLGFPVK